MEKKGYQCFDRIILRTPIFSFTKLNEKDKLFNRNGILHNKIFNEAITLASPNLSREIIKYKQKQFEKEKLLKFKISILKYFIRMCTRCTPFGLFAGCGVCSIGDESEVLISHSSKFYTKTRLDMDYLCYFLRNIMSIADIKKHLKYHVNSSIYSVGKKIRYVECDYSGINRKYRLVEVEKTDYLEKILLKAKSFSKIEELVQVLVDKDITEDDAKNYIHDLISSQLLISEIEPTIVGNELVKTTINRIEKLPNTKHIIYFLKKIEKLFSDIDSAPIGRPIESYTKIKEELKTFKFEYNEKYIFQSDLYINVDKGTIDNSIIEIVKRTIPVLSKVTEFSDNKLIENFKNDFYRKYEEKEIPLLLALDTELGISFGSLTSQSSDISPFLNSIKFHHKSNINHTTFISPVQSMLNKKYENFLTNGSKEIEIVEDDIKEFKENFEELPNTISALVEIIQTEKKGKNPLIYMRNAGGSSAANMLGRFCFLNNQINNLVKRITNKEQDLFNNKIVAEIIHLPESRTGNVISRPSSIRHYKIPYLTLYNGEEGEIISTEDIMVSVPNGKYIMLRSKKLNKEIIPRLTNAHNFRKNSLPVYYFLCTLQNQNLKGTIGFSWGSLRTRPYLPRVRFSDVILSPAIWNITMDEIKDIPKVTDQNFYTEVNKFRKKREIPDKVYYVEGDNKLLVDFKHLLSIQMLFLETKKKDFQLEEILFNDEYPIIRRGKEVFSNQFVFCLYKEKQL